MSSVGIIDIGMGNISSVKNSLKKIGIEAKLIQHPDELNVDILFLPGVGAFPEAMKRLIAEGLDAKIQDYCANGGILVGICLGMQLLFESSQEEGGSLGLGLLEGNVVPLDVSEKFVVPHMGWNTIHSLYDEYSEFEGDVYFVHSFKCVPRHREDIIFECFYDEKICVAVKRGNIFGFQFHPEKSQHLGLRILRKVILNA